jgi:hypothetical protein
MLAGRIALAGLISAVACAAFAQDTAAPPTPSVPPAPANPPAAETPAAPTSPPAPHPAPTGDAAQIISVLEHFCIPAIQGGSADKLANQLGMHKNRDDELVLPLGNGKRITVSPPDPSNPTVCSLTVLYDIGGDGPIYDALNNWALDHSNPYVQARAKESSQVGDETHITSTWSAVEADGAEGLVFIQARTAAGKPLNSRTDQATILFSIRPN